MTFDKIFPSEVNDHYGPSARSGHRLVMDEKDIYFYGGYNPVFGGFAGVPGPERKMEDFPMFRESWKFNLISEQWERLTTTGSAPKESASYASLLVHGRLLVIGGTGFPFAEVRSNDLYCLNLSTLEWTIVNCHGAMPDKVYGHSLVFANDCIYLFGGTTGFSYHNDVFRLDLCSLEWKLLYGPEESQEVLLAPSGRYRQEMTTDGKHLYIFGGGTALEAEPMDVVWTFDLESHKWERISTTTSGNQGFPAPRKCHGCSQHGDYVYISGGLGADNIRAYKDIWRFHMPSRQWTELSITLPKEMYFHGTVVSSVTGAIYTFGGVTSDPEVHESRAVRTQILLKADMEVKPLTELCWERIIQAGCLQLYPRTKLLECGIPHRYILRLGFGMSSEGLSPIASPS